MFKVINFFARKKKNLCKETREEIYYQLINALKKIHDKGIIHNDLKLFLNIILRFVTYITRHIILNEQDVKVVRLI